MINTKDMMMNIKNILKIFPITCLLMASCSNELDDDGEGKGVDNGKKARIEIFTNADAYQAPVTKIGVADENTVGTTPWVLVFRGTGDNAAFFEAQQAVTSGGSTYVNLTRTTEYCRVMIIGNAPGRFNNGSGNVVFNEANLITFCTAKTFTQVADGLLTETLDSPQQTVPYAPTVSDPSPLIPMSGTTVLYGIDQNTTIGTVSNKISLVRIIAKVTVKSESPDFILMGATVINTPRNARFYQSSSSSYKNNSSNLTNFLNTSSSEPVIGIAYAEQNNTENVCPIYIYEARKEENTSVIVQGIFNNAMYYYKLVFKNENATMDILRNKHYRFIIKNVSMAGYSTLAEAMNAAPANMQYDILVADLSSHDVIDNGRYFLALSNSEYHVCKDNASSLVNLHAFTAVTNATATMGLTSNSVTSLTSGLTVNTGSLAFSSSESSSRETYILISLAAGFSSGAIKIEFGNLIKTVTVKRQELISTYGGAILLGTEYGIGQIVTPASWITLSTEQEDYDWKGTTGDTVINTEENGTIYAQVDFGTGVERAVDIYLGRREPTGGRVKMRFAQR